MEGEEDVFSAELESRVLILTKEANALKAELRAKGAEVTSAQAANRNLEVAFATARATLEATISELQAVQRDLEVRLKSAMGKVDALSHDNALEGGMHRESQGNYEQEVKWHAVDLYIDY